MKKPRKHIPGADKPQKYGYFAKDGLSYCVTSTETPRPWCNLLGNLEFGGQFSQCGQGFLWYLSHNHEQVTNWQEMHYSPSRLARGRLVFIKDRQTGKYWTANPQPGERGFSDFYCKVEPGVSTIHAKRNGMDFTMRAFVPWDANVEVWTLTLRNTGRDTRRLAVIPAIEFPTRRITTVGDATFHKDLQAVHSWDSDKRQPVGAFFASDAKVAAFDTNWDTFYGPLNDRLHPRALESGLSNSESQNDYCVGVLEIRTALGPGESFSFNVFTGRAYEKKDIAPLLRRFRKPGAVEEALCAVRSVFERQRQCVQVRIPDRLMQTALNCWSPYCVSIAARFRQMLKVGYRDVLQYQRAHLIFDHKWARENILRILEYQYACGRSVRAYRPHDGSVDARDARDGVSWIADTLCSYIKETGDTGILDEEVPFLDRGHGTVWEHAVRAVTFLFKHRGRHRMCLVGGGDWNDSLELGGKHGRGESVWLTIATCRALRITAEIARHIGKNKDAERFEGWRRALARDVNRIAWDGNWYIYGYNDEGEPVGSKKNAEGRIFANVQSWALMEHIVPADRVNKVWKSLEDYLITDAGTLVLHPPYTKYRTEIGRISAIATGNYEHAAAYVHGTAFAVGAYAANKLGEKAVATWHLAHPTNPLNPNSGCEPYACTTYFTGPSSRHYGRSLNSWFTGSAAWIYFLGIEEILGIKTDFNGLRIDPAIPRTWNGYAVIRKFRGATYRIIVHNPDRVSGGVRQMTVDGRLIPGNIVPVMTEGYHDVNVVMG